MTKRAQRCWLALLAAALFLCSAAAIALPFTTDWSGAPTVVRSTPGLSGGDGSPDDQEPTEQSLTADDFRQYWSRQLRRPLYDPPPPPPQKPVVVEPPPPRPIAAKLLATMVEPGKSMAMLRLSTGEVVFRKVDEEIGGADTGAKVLAVEDGVISVERDKQTSKLTVDGQKVN